jgi:SAM-dependent methyltransferase
MNLKLLTQTPIARKLISTIRQIRPSIPQIVGLSYYQKASYWALDRNQCPCDLEFVDYLKRSAIANKTIFHFGTGGHHIVGLENQKFARPNEVIGITASVPEHRAYTQLVLKDSTLAKDYKVLFADIYTLTQNTLPTFDLVALFHLCEFYLPENAASVHQNDESLVQLFLDKLNPDGKLVFYTGSWAWNQAEAIVRTFESAGKIKQIDQYKTLLIYAAC